MLNQNQTKFPITKAVLNTAVQSVTYFAVIHLDPILGKKADRLVDGA